MSDFTGSGGAAYMSNRMDWETPTDLFAKLDDEFGFTLDAAASASNHKCAKYYTAEDSAFDHEWGGETVFCNPPYGKAIAEWVRKCSMEASRKDTSSSCSCPPAPTLDGSNSTFSTVRRFGSSKADSISRRTACRVTQPHSQV